MDNHQFGIDADPSRCLLRITFRGHWNVDTVRAYRAALGKVSKRMRDAGCLRGQTIVLVDARGIGAQSQEVIASYKAEMGGGELAVRRLATLVTSALFKRQVERIAIANQRLFTDEHVAMEWLLSPTETDEPPA